METASAQCIPQNTYKVVSVHKWSKNVHWILTISIKSYLDNKSQERFYRVPVSKWSRARTVDKDILIRYMFSDKTFPQPLLTTNDLLQEQGIWHNTTSSLFHKLLANVMWMKIMIKTVSWKENHRSLLRFPWQYHFLW